MQSVGSKVLSLLAASPVSFQLTHDAKPDTSENFTAVFLILVLNYSTVQMFEAGFKICRLLNILQQRIRACFYTLLKDRLSHHFIGGCNRLLTSFCLLSHTNSRQTVMLI